MKFVTNETFTDEVEINTLDELKAYALGGTGTIEINFVAINPMTGEPAKPTIKAKWGE